MQQAEDFRAESAALYHLVSELDDKALAQPTLFKGWTIANVLGHLHFWDRAAYLTLTDEAAFAALMQKTLSALPSMGMRAFEAQWLDGMGLGGTRLRDVWHDFSTTVADAYAQADEKQRVQWAGPGMSARSMITARQMEAWAHGQAVFDVLGVERRNTDRLRNVAVLGVNTFEWTFKNRKEPVPGQAPLLRLTAPSGALWEFNPDNRADAIIGEAEEFCQVVTQVRNIEDTSLQVSGPVATRWMAWAQCFAGPPVDPPGPGTRYRVPAAGVQSISP